MLSSSDRFSCDESDDCEEESLIVIPAWNANYVKTWQKGILS